MRTEVAPVSGAEGDPGFSAAHRYWASATEETGHSLTIEQENQPTRIILHVRGRLTMDQLGTLQEFLDRAWRASAARVIVNLAGCPYADSAGIALLVAARQRARQAGKEFVLVGLSAQVWSLVEMTRLQRVFDICNTLEAALVL